MSSGMEIGGSRGREALVTVEPKLEGPAPGKQTRADPSSSPEQGAPYAAPGPRADGALADARAEDWGMSPDLASALGVGGLEEQAPQGNAPVQRRPLSMPGWAQPQLKVQQSVAADAAQTSASATLAFVREEGLTLRVGPGQQAAALTHMTFGQRVHVLEGAGQGDWLKVAVLGQTGYAYKPRIHFPPKDLVAKDPGVSLIKVKSGQTFWGLVKDSYGIQGNESSRDQNINHFINAIRAVNKPEAFKVKTDVLDDLGNAAILGRDASDTELNAGVDLWIPSFGVAAKMDVSSGTARGEVTRYAKKFDQKIEDFGAACRASGKYMPAAVRRNAGEMAMGMLQGLIDFALDAAKILAASTAAGALVGALFGGVGAAPGAAIGFELGLVILEYYGLYMLVEAVLGVAGNLMGQLGQFIALAWDANGDQAKIEKAGQALAEALGILVSALLIVVAAYLLKRGANALSKTKFAQKVGETRLAKWFEERQQGTTTKEQLAKEQLAKEKAAKEPATKEEAAKEEAANGETTKSEPAKTKEVSGETDATRVGKQVHKANADARRQSGEWDDVNTPMKTKDGKPVEVPKRVNLKTGEPAGMETQAAQPDAVSYKRGEILDDKPAGRPISKDRQEMIRNIEAYRQRTGELPKKIIVERYDPATGKHVDTEIYSPSDFLPQQPGAQ